MPKPRWQGSQRRSQGREFESREDTRPTTRRQLRRWSRGLLNALRKDSLSPCVDRDHSRCRVRVQQAGFFSHFHRIRAMDNRLPRPEF